MDESFYFFLGGECVGPQNLVKHYVASSHNRLVLPEEKKKQTHKMKYQFSVVSFAVEKRILTCVASHPRRIVEPFLGRGECFV